MDIPVVLLPKVSHVVILIDFTVNIHTVLNQKNWSGYLYSTSECTCILNNFSMDIPMVLLPKVTSCDSDRFDGEYTYRAKSKTDQIEWIFLQHF